MKNYSVQTFIFVAFIMTCFGVVTPVSPTPESLRGVWLGFTSSANDFYRIEFRESGGQIGCSFSGENVKIYEIHSWKLAAKGQLDMKISPISTNAYPIIVRAKALGGQIELQVMDHSKGWRHNLILHREEFIRNRVESLRQAMQQ